jgi:acyl carrier protein
MTTNEVLELIADTINVSAEELRTEETGADHLEWDSLDIMALLARLQKSGVSVVIPDDLSALHSVDGILELFRASGKLE